MTDIRRPEDIPNRVERLAMIARWKPVHVGHAAVLEALVARARHAVIGIGSSNRYNALNPFTVAETVEMIRIVLGERENYTVLGVPDLGHGPRWRAMVLDLLGPLDLFVTANPYVRDLLRNDYRVVHPAWLVPRERHVAVDGTTVRRCMARGDDWRSLVPQAVADFLERRRLVDRFVREFGAATRALDKTETSS
jgi:nicotinamide-nucleotide adenylyltransferase